MRCIWGRKMNFKMMLILLNWCKVQADFQTVAWKKKKKKNSCIRIKINKVKIIKNKLKNYQIQQK